MTPEPDLGTLKILALLVIWAALFSWIVVADRLARRQPLLAWWPRRLVPWNGAAVGLIFAVFVVNQSVCSYWADRLWRSPATAEVGQGSEPASAETSPGQPALGEGGATFQPPADDDEGAAAHLLVQFLAAQRGAAWAIWLAGFVGVVVAPLAEELLFRALFQGWLESRETTWRRQWPPLRRLSRGAIPISLPALIFALLHFRQGPAEAEPESLGPVLFGNAAASLLTFFIAGVLLRRRFRATLEDLGLSLANWRGDLVRGGLALGAALVPVYGLQYALTELLQPLAIAADPAALFLLALVLGYLYFRTHRVLPSLVVHVGLNAVALLATWLALQDTSVQ